MSLKTKYFQMLPIIFLLVIGLFGCTGKDETQLETQAPVQQEQPEDQAEAEIPTQTNLADVEEPAAIEEEKEKGFATSEDAVLSYLAGLRDNDFGRMEDSFFDKSGAVDISNQCAHLCEIDLIPEIVSDGYIQLSEDKDAEKFLEQLTEKIESTDFKGMEFLGFVSLDELFNNDDSMAEVYQNMLDMTAENNGGSELKSQVAAIQINDTKYLLFFDTIMADDKWYIYQLGGILPNLAGAEPEDLGGRLSAEDESILPTLLADSTDTLKLPDSETDTVERNRAESEGYDTPEEAVTAYLEGLKACDTDQMLSTFSVESYAENYDMLAYLERTNVYMFLQQEVTLPPVNDFTKAMISCEREQQLREDILNQGNMLYLWNCYYKDADLEPGAFFEWEELQAELELDSIEAVDFIAPETFWESGTEQAAEEMWNQRAGIYGADQIQDCVAVFTCGGEKYCLFMETAQYHDRWYNNSFGYFTFMSTGFGSDSMGTLPFEAIEESYDF